VNTFSDTNPQFNFSSVIILYLSIFQPRSFKQVVGGRQHVVPARTTKRGRLQVRVRSEAPSEAEADLQQHQWIWKQLVLPDSGLDLESADAREPRTGRRSRRRHFPCPQIASTFKLIQVKSGFD
jgi:hypothetical protein